jgi:MFS family permease
LTSSKKSRSSSGLKNVFNLGLVSFFTDFSTEMILGILPLFVVNNLGASRAMLGIMEGSAELIGYAFRMVSGSLSDYFKKRKIFVLVGYGLSTISKPFFAFSTSWIDAVLVRVIDRMGKGIRTAPRDALIADSVSESISGKAFGIHRTIDQIGAILGPIVAFAILQVLDIQWVFLFSLVPGIVAVIILLFFVKEIIFVNKDQTSSSGNHKKEKISLIANTLALVKENKAFVTLMIISGVFGLGAFSFSFVLLKSQDYGIAANDIPLVYAAINVAHTIIGIPAGILGDKIGREKVLILGFLVFVISSLLMIFLPFSHYLYAYLIAIVFGLYIGIIETIQRAVIPKYVSSVKRGTAYGLYYLIVGLSFFVCNVIFGFLWDEFSFDIAIIYSLTLSIAAIIGTLLFMRKYITVPGP